MAIWWKVPMVGAVVTSGPMADPGMSGPLALPQAPTLAPMTLALPRRATRQPAPGQQRQSVVFVPLD